MHKPLNPIAGARSLLLCLLLGACASNQPELPDTIDDGLVRVENTTAQAVYRDPDADMSHYDRVYITDVAVAFKKDWLRDQNRKQTAASQRLTQQDADRIKDTVAMEFTRIFTEELDKGGYPVVSTLDTGVSNENLLILRPAIVDLDVTAPDVPTPGRSQTYTASNGSMTLYLEFYDAITGDLLGKVADARAVRDRNYLQISNSVTNKAEADRMMRRWAQLLVKAMDRAHGRS